MNPPSSRESSVLIIDDDQNLCQTMEDLVSSWGMKSLSYTRPPSGSDWIRLNATDVFLLDVHMPHVNGLDLIPAITELVPDAKIMKTWKTTSVHHARNDHAKTHSSGYASLGLPRLF